MALVLALGGVVTVAAPGANAASSSTNPSSTASSSTGSGPSNPNPSSSPSAGSKAIRDRIAITLTALEPKVVRPHDVVTLDGTLTNKSGHALSNVAVVLRGSSHRVETRYDLAREADPTVVIGNTFTDTRQIIGALPADATATWHMSLPVDQLDLPESSSDFGAYPIAIEVRSTLDGAALTTRLPTSLMWMPAGAQFVPTQLSWLMPLVDGVHRANGDVFLDDLLAQRLSNNGRLGRLLDLATTAPVPLTYFIDPALVDDASVMAGTAGQGGAGADRSNAATSSAPQSGPYQVSADPAAPAKQVPGRGTAAATAWLTELRTLVAAPQAAFAGLPYADADIVAIERAGLEKEIAIARSTSQSTLSADLTKPTLPNVVWPVGGVLNESTLDALASDLVDTVVVSDQALPARNGLAVTGIRTNLQTAAGTVRAVLTDSAISSLLGPQGSGSGGARATEQRFLAETMLVTEQRPGSGSAIVAAPPRDWDPADGLGATLLSDSATMPWLKGANLGQLAALPTDGVPRSSLVYPASARSAELSTSELTPIAALRNNLSTFGAILGSSTTETFANTVSASILRSESSGLRNRPGAPSLLRRQVQSYLDLQTARVYVIRPGLITLTSRKQKIPITIVNGLSDPVTVQLRLTAVNAARLTVTPLPPITVAGNQSRQEVLVEVEATTGGRFDVTAQLWTPESSPRPYGAAVPFVLNSTAYGAVALAIAAAAAGLVFLLSASRILRRIRRARRTHATSAELGTDQLGLDAGPLGPPELEPAEPARTPQPP